MAKSSRPLFSQVNDATFPVRRRSHNNYSWSTCNVIGPFDFASRLYPLMYFLPAVRHNSLRREAHSMRYHTGMTGMATITTRFMAPPAGSHSSDWSVDVLSGLEGLPLDMNVGYVLPSAGKIMCSLRSTNFLPCDRRHVVSTSNPGILEPRRHRRRIRGRRR